MIDHLDPKEDAKVTLFFVENNLYSLTSLQAKCRSRTAVRPQKIVSHVSNNQFETKFRNLPKKTLNRTKYMPKRLSFSSHSKNRDAKLK